MTKITTTLGKFRDSLQRLKEKLRAINRHRIYLRRMKAGIDYESWIKKNDSPNEQDQAMWSDWVKQNPNSPIVNIILPYQGDTDLFLINKSITSILEQYYQNWNLFIVTAPETHQPPLASDDRILVTTSDSFTLSSINGTWTAILEVGDQLRPHSLLFMIQSTIEHPDAKIIYADEDQIDQHGHRSKHHFKPDWNYDFQLSSGYLGNAWIVEQAHLLACGGHTHLAGKSAIYDTTLRCAAELQAKQVVHISDVLLHKAAKPTQPMDETFVTSLQSHLDRHAPGALATVTRLGHLKITYPIPEKPPLVSILICTRNQYTLLRTCIESIKQKTDYPNYEIIVVDNGSDDDRTLKYLLNLPETDPRIKVIRDDRPFNYSALNNMAAEHSQGELLALLNNDIEVIEGSWLTEMAGHALRPDVGCVGAKLLYPDNTIQHAGVLVGSGMNTHGTVASHYSRGTAEFALGYGNRSVVTLELTAVTAACLLVKKSTFKIVEGLDAKNLSVAYNDVDFCLRVGELGLKNIWTPHALLYHHESISRGRDTSRKNIQRFIPEALYMKNRWIKYRKCDPHYNPNLNQERPDFSLNEI